MMSISASLHPESQNTYVLFKYPTSCVRDTPILTERPRSTVMPTRHRCVPPMEMDTDNPKSTVTEMYFTTSVLSTV